MFYAENYNAFTIFIFSVFVINSSNVVSYKYIRADNEQKNCVYKKCVYSFMIMRFINNNTQCI